MNKRLIYLDNSATTFPKPEIVYKEMDMVNREMAVNAGRGSYSLAKKASEMIVDVKKKILELFNAPERAEVILTPSITIALNQILQGITVPSGSNIYVSPYEHNAVARTVNLIAKRCNVNIIEIPIDVSSLEIDMKRLESIFALHKPYVVCCSHISNVTGYILPVEEIFNLSKKYNAINVLDTAQSAGLININLCKLNADFVAFAGHKTLYGPFGIGGFVDISKIKLNEVIVGGTGSDSLNLDMPSKLPDRYESSSMNITAIAGLKVALDYIKKEGVTEDTEKELTRYLVKKLKEVPDIQLYLPQNKDNHISIVSFNIIGYKAEEIGMLLDQDYNISVRTGYHCAPYIHSYLKDTSFLGTIRVGLGIFNTKQEIDKLVEALNEIIEG